MEILVSVLSYFSLCLTFFVMSRHERDNVLILVTLEICAVVVDGDVVTSTVVEVSAVINTKVMHSITRLNIFDDILCVFK